MPKKKKQEKRKNKMKMKNLPKTKLNNYKEL